MLMLNKWKVTNNFSPYFVEFHAQLSFWKKNNLQPDLDPNYLPQGIKQLR